MINKEIITSKINNILNYLEELRPLLELDDNYLLNKNNYRDLRTLERDFQLIVDTMIEINSHFIKKLDLKVPDNYTNTFIVLGQNDVLPINFANQLAAVVGLKNKVVHKYDIIDMVKFINDLKPNSHQFTEYLKHIKDYVKYDEKQKLKTE